MSKTKMDIVRQVSQDTGKTQSLVQDIIERTLEAVAFATADGESVVFKGFGTFEPRTSSEGKYYDPVRKTMATRGPRKKVVLRLHRAYKDILNG